MKITEIFEKIVLRGKNIIKKKVARVVEESEYKATGMPIEELDCMRRYMRSRYANRYLSAYLNEGIKRVVIQIGMDKTASTSIQTFLHENQVLLHDHSIEFKADWGSNNHSIPLKSMVAEEPEKIYHHIVSGFTSEQILEYNCKNLLALCRGIRACEQETYVFFGEGICSFRKVEYRSLKNMLSVLMPNAEVEILYCARSNIGYASSAYQQAAKVGRYHDDKEQIKRYSRLYKKRLTNAIRAFGKEKIEVYKFEETIKHEFGPVGYFLEKLGVANEALCPLEMARTNESVSAQAIEIVEYMNKKHPMTLDDEKNTVRQRQDTDPILKISGRRYQITNEVASCILKAAKKDILWLENHFACAYPTVHPPIVENELNYDERYYTECIGAFDELSNFMKQEFYEFVVQKHRSVVEPYHKELFVKIKIEMSRDIK